MKSRTASVVAGGRVGVSATSATRSRISAAWRDSAVALISEASTLLRAAHHHELEQV